MEWLDNPIHRFGVFLSRALEPVSTALDIVDRLVEKQLTVMGVPYTIQSPIITGLWALVILILLRSSTGWARLIALVATALVLAKVFGFLPLD